MFPNYIGRFGCQKKETTQQKTNKEKSKKKNKKLKNGNNSTYHEPLPEEWIGRRY